MNHQQIYQLYSLSWFVIYLVFSINSKFLYIKVVSWLFFFVYFLDFTAPFVPPKHSPALLLLLSNKWNIPQTQLTFRNNHSVLVQKQWRKPTLEGKSLQHKGFLCAAEAPTSLENFVPFGSIVTIFIFEMFFLSWTVEQTQLDVQNGSCSAWGWH